MRLGRLSHECLLEHGDLGRADDPIPGKAQARQGPVCRQLEVGFELADGDGHGPRCVRRKLAVQGERSDGRRRGHFAQVEREARGVARRELAERAAAPALPLDPGGIRHGRSVPLYDVVLGTEVVVPTMTGQVALTLPPESQNGRVFRLGGQGMPKLGAPSERGTLYVTIKSELPTALTDEERQLFEQLQGLRKDTGGQDDK